MGLFKRSKKTPQPTDRIEWLTATARRILAEQGVETTVGQGKKPEEVMLVSAGVQIYPLFTLFAKLNGASIAEAEPIIAEHLSPLPLLRRNARHLDLPHTVIVLTDANIRTLALGENELYAFGQLNTDH